MGQFKIGMIVSGFPRRSETFALQELLALEKQGLLARVFATKAGDGAPPHPDCQPLLERVEHLPPGSPAEQARVVIKRLKDDDIFGIHGYFAHIPAEVASLAARALGVPYGFSTHALDARKVSAAVLKERVQNAACIIACNHDVARDLSLFGGEVTLMPHGVDIGRFHPAPLPAGKPIRLLSVGRLVEKKGFNVLIQALRRVSSPFHLKIIGEGVERERLTREIQDANLSDCVTLCGGMTHAGLPAEYEKAHIVVVPSIVDHNGDRDGLPNVVLEAMASGRPVIACDVGAISSAVVHRETGLLLPPGDPGALSDALELLSKNPALCRRLGRNARKRIERDFELDHCTARLSRFLISAYSGWHSNLNHAMIC
ncbi:MAG: glycosyltransferase [Nitrospiria bacterium]